MTPEQALKIVNDAFFLPSFTVGRNDFRTIEAAMAQLQATVEQVAKLQAGLAEPGKPTA